MESSWRGHQIIFKRVASFLHLLRHAPSKSPSLWEGRRIRLRIGQGGFKNFVVLTNRGASPQSVNDRLPSPTCAIINDGEFDPPLPNWR